jgi:hypothetical protein
VGENPFRFSGSPVKHYARFGKREYLLNRAALDIQQKKPSVFHGSKRLNTGPPIPESIGLPLAI